MNESITIEKIESDVEGLDFEGLKRDGIRLLQELCGQTWTDYNEHDPGITTLEQLCYALTDLKYRTEFDIADYLVGAGGSIDLDGLALFRPEDVFPCRPTTVNDYRMAFSDEIPEIDGVWLRAVHNAGTQGLYRVYAKPNESSAASDPVGQAQRIAGRIKDVYAANRNLCEDLEEVCIVKNRPFFLQGTIEINGKRDPVAILAQVYFQCANFISPGIIFQAYDKALREGGRPETVFEGPLTRHGYISEGDLKLSREVVTISELMGLIGEIEGVTYVEELWFEEDQSQSKRNSIAYDSSLEVVPALKFPEEDARTIALLKNGRKYRVSAKAVRVAFDRLNADFRLIRQKRQNFEELFPAPQGEYRDLQQYYSIQNNFPLVYGVNPAGLPDSAPPKRKAQAKQLKAYLLLFEQIMANFLANIQNLSKLFSTDRQLNRTYFHQWLRNQHIPNIDGLYSAGTDDAGRKIGHITSGFDRYGDRRNRLLDYLLALYGESFTQNSLRQFNYYHTEDEQQQEMIRNKITFVNHIVETSQKRAGAFDYRKESWNTDNFTGLKKKAGILLGLQNLENRTLADVFGRNQLSVVPDDLLPSLVDLEYVDEDRVQQQFGTIPVVPISEHDGDRLFEEIIYLQNKLISLSVLRSGIFLDSYRMGPSHQEGRFDLVSKPTGLRHWYRLSTYATEAEAVVAANQLRRYLIHLNRICEGFHILEHVLLRPLGGHAHEIAVPDDFYSFRISVIFPAWTARFSDPEFRKLAQETILLNCPAHVLPDFHWLEIDQLETFENLYRNWLEAKCDSDGPAEAIDRHSQGLISFLIKQDRS